MGEFLLCFVYVWNWICQKGNKITPFELYSVRKLSVAHLKNFVCLAYASVSRQTKRKLDMRAKLGVMLGYVQQTKSYHISLNDDNKLLETLNVRFDKTKRGFETISSPKVLKRSGM